MSNALTDWKILEGDYGHWKVLDAVIDYEAGARPRSARTCGR
jgi:hypothetical protein